MKKNFSPYNITRFEIVHEKRRELRSRRLVKNMSCFRAFCPPYNITSPEIVYRANVRMIASAALPRSASIASVIRFSYWAFVALTASSRE